MLALTSRSHLELVAVVANMAEAALVVARERPPQDHPQPPGPRRDRLWSVFWGGCTGCGLWPGIAMACDRDELIAVLERAAWGHGRSVTIWIAKIPIVKNGRGGQLCCTSLP